MHKDEEHMGMRMSDGRYYGRTFQISNSDTARGWLHLSVVATAFFLLVAGISALISFNAEAGIYRTTGVVVGQVVEGFRPWPSIIEYEVEGQIYTFIHETHLREGSRYGLAVNINDVTDISFSAGSSVVPGWALTGAALTGLAAFVYFVMLMISKYSERRQPKSLIDK